MLFDVRGEPGAHVGEYQVSVYPAPSQTQNSPADVVSTGNTNGPAIYINPVDSPLRATVPPGGGTVEVKLDSSGLDGTTTTTPIKNPL